MKSGLCRVAWVAAVLAAIASACVPESPPQAAPLVYTDDAVLLSDEDARSVTEFDREAGLLRIPAALGERMDVGSVITSPPGSEAGSGLLERVVGLSVDGPIAVVETQPAAVADLVQSGTWRSDVSPTADDLDGLAPEQESSELPGLRAASDGGRRFCDFVAGLDVCLEIDSFDFLFREAAVVGSGVRLKNTIGIDQMAGRVTVRGDSARSSGVVNLVKPAEMLAKAVSPFGFAVELKIGVAYDVAAGIPIDVSIPFNGAQLLLDFDCSVVCTPQVVTDSGLADGAFGEVFDGLQSQLLTEPVVQGNAMFGLGATVGLRGVADRLCGAGNRLIGADAQLRAGLRGSYGFSRPVPLSIGWFSEALVTGTRVFSGSTECRIERLTGQASVLEPVRSFERQEAPIWLTSRLQLAGGSGDPTGADFDPGRTFSEALGAPLTVGIAQLDGQWPQPGAEQYPPSIVDQAVTLFAESRSGGATIRLGSAVSDSTGLVDFSQLPLPPPGRWQLRVEHNAFARTVAGEFEVAGAAETEYFSGTVGLSGTQQTWLGFMTEVGSGQGCYGTSFGRFSAVSCDSHTSFMSIITASDGTARWAYNSRRIWTHTIQYDEGPCESTLIATETAESGPTMAQMGVASQSEGGLIASAVGAVRWTTERSQSGSSCTPLTPDLEFQTGVMEERGLTIPAGGSSSVVDFGDIRDPDGPRGFRSTLAGVATFTENFTLANQVEVTRNLAWSMEWAE